MPTRPAGLTLAAPTGQRPPLAEAAVLAAFGNVLRPAVS